MLIRGAFKPLLYICCLFVILLAGCSSTPIPPSLQTTGYITDQSVVRIWRKNDANHRPLTIAVLYDYFDGRSDDIYLNYHAGKLLEIIRHQDKPEKTEDHIRFDLSGHVTFMQHTTDTGNSSLQPDVIDTIKYIAAETVKLSDLLALADVKLGQGYVENNRVTDCSGKVVTLNLNDQQINWVNTNLNSENKHPIAWLSSPSGDQLFLFTQIDYCQSIPQL